MPVAPVPAPSETTALVPTTATGPSRENRATFLVLHNDLEALMAAMLCANGAAAMGMDTMIFFSFWGVNTLRADEPRNLPGESRGWLQAAMQWMMPSGPERQRLGKMHMGGLGTGMMRYFMRKNNVLGLEQLMKEAVELDVKFVVCTMSMGVMGIQKRDLVDLPNMEFAGVTSFMESARRSAVSLVF